MIVDMSFPHEYEITEDLKGPYIGDSEVRLTSISGLDYFRFIVSGDRSWTLSLQRAYLCGILSTPAPKILCAVSAGECFLVDTATCEPTTKRINPTPAVDFKALESHALLLLVGFTYIVAIGKSGKVQWTSADLAHDGLTITHVEGNILKGLAEGIPGDTHEFELDLTSGKHIGGYYGC